MEEQKTLTKKFEHFHDKHYKHMLLLPILLMILSLAYLFYFYSQTGDFINKDISLTGGTSITLYGDFDSAKIQSDLSDKLNEINTREIYDLITREKVAIIIETKSDGEDSRYILEEYLGRKLDEKNSSFEFTGPALSQSFYKQLLIAIIFAFVFMGAVVFVMFRKFVPSVAVIISAFADIFMTLALVNFLGIEMSSAGIVAFLMLIGYSVDTDILLTNRVLRSHEGTVNERIFKSFKTGMAMTLIAIVSISISLIIVKSFSVVLTQIFSVILFGLFFDIMNTWVTNVSIIKWYAKKHEN